MSHEVAEPQRIDKHFHTVSPAYSACLEARGERPGGIALPERTRDSAQ